MDPKFSLVVSGNPRAPKKVWWVLELENGDDSTEKKWGVSYKYGYPTMDDGLYMFI